jgi:hypothetical protein
MQVTAPQPVPAIQLRLRAPSTQRRATVAFRLILAVPAFVWLYLLWIAGYFAALAGWVAALFTGRLPKGIAEFLTKIIRYQTRVTAYGFLLLTDTYPPFDLETDDYPVELDVPPPGRLNRAAVLFRFILVIPASLVATIVMVGAWPVVVLTWLILLLSGRMPRSMFEAFNAILRYQQRYFGYWVLLTSEYPKKLFGDATTPLADTPVAASDPPAATPPPTPPIGAPSTIAATPRITRLVLSTGAKRIVALCLFLGAAFYVGGFVAIVVTAGQFESAQDEFLRIENEVAEDSLNYGRETQSCALNGGLPCLQAANGKLADAIGHFREELNEIEFPSQALDEADDLDEAAAAFEAALRNLETAPDEATYQRLLAEVQAVGSRVSGAELRLAQALNIRFG